MPDTAGKDGTIKHVTTIRTLRLSAPYGRSCSSARRERRESNSLLCLVVAQVTGIVGPPI